MKCFIISPIGAEGSPVRKHADDVFKCVIQPALKLANVVGHRADHREDVGRISKQMFSDILGADFCIGLLKGYNPNVFYELAVAHSAGIPVILLREKGDPDPPFDLRDERVFDYDLSPQPIMNNENPVALAKRIELLRPLKGERTVPFGAEGMTPLNAAPIEQLVSVARETASSAEFWLSHVESAKHRYYIAGIALGDWRGNAGMADALRNAVRRGVDIRILTMHGDNPALSAMLNDRISQHASEHVGTLASSVRSHFRSAFGNRPNAQIRAIRKGMLHQQIIISDDRALVTPYLYSLDTGRSPRIDSRKGAGIFDAALREFNALWSLNARNADDKAKTAKSPSSKQVRSSRTKPRAKA
jgi:hypothetical protein